MGTPVPSADEGTRPAQRTQFEQGFKALRHVLYGFVAIIFIAISTLWWWAGTDDSLAQALRLGRTCCGQRLQALTLEQASGSLRSGGRVGRLAWRQDGLTVEGRGVTLAWQPWALLDGTLQLSHLTFDSLQIDDQRPAPATPATGPPDALGLPLRVTLEAFSIGNLRWAGPTAAASFSA